MQVEYSNLVRNYHSWLADKTFLRQIDDWFEITTPYLNRHNDYLQIYAKRVGDKYILSDDAQTIRDLQLSGCELDTEKRIYLLQEILNGFHVQRQGDELITEATTENFSVRKHSLLQAVLAVDDLFYLAQPYIKSLFFEDVASWLDSIGARYLSNVKLTGRSGFDYNYDFVVTKSRERPERLLSAVNNLDINHAKNMLTAWLDTKDSRPPDAEAYAIINDAIKAPPESSLNALKMYEIKPVIWSARQNAESAFDR